MTGSGGTVDRPARRHAGRLALAALYLLGGVAHAVVFARSPAVYRSFADLSPLAVYRTTWETVVVPNLAVLVPLVAVFELAVGVELVRGGRAARVAHVAGAGFQAALVPSGPWGQINAALALVHVAGARRES